MRTLLVLTLTIGCQQAPKADTAPADTAPADTAPPEPPGWIDEPALPYEVTENSAAAIGPHIYVLGGFVGLAVPADVWRYDSVNTTWQPVAPMPKNGYHHASLVAANGKLYFVAAQNGGAFTPVGDTFEYDPITDAWQGRKPSPIPRGAAGAAVINGLIYVAGGVTDTGITGSLAVYDPAANEWDIDRTPMPLAREHVAACALAGRLHIVGGRIGGLNNQDAHDVYTPETDLWSTADSLPTPRSGIAAAVLAGRCHVFGGEQSSGTFNTHEAWSHSDGWVTYAPMLSPRHGLGAVTVGNRIHIVGGGPEPGFTFSDKHESFAL